MEIKEFLDHINNHTKAIYENEIEQVKENGTIINWLLGLAGGALLFSFNKYDSVNEENIPIIIFQAAVFVAIILVGFLHRVKTKTFRDNTTSMIRMFGFLKIEFQLVPDELENELENERLITVFDNYINGEYFDEEDKDIFEDLSKRQRRNYTLTKVLTTLSIVLMVVQFACFFYLIVK